MGANLRDVQVGGASTVTLWVVGIFFVAIICFVLYKYYLFLQEQKKWDWLTKMCKEKKMSDRETEYMKKLCTKNNFKSEDDIYDSLFKLSIPTPLKRKLME